MSSAPDRVDDAGGFQVTTDRDAMDVAFVHHFLSERTHWARGIPLAVVRRSLEHSLCFGGFLDGSQIAFARVVTDRSTFANLMDVFVVPEHRGHGYGKLLMAAVLEHPDLRRLRRFTLATMDAHGLYARFGFAAPLRPESLMERYDPGLYSAGRAPP